MELFKTMNNIQVQFLNIPSVSQAIYRHAKIGKKHIGVSLDMQVRQFDANADMSTIMESILSLDHSSATSIKDFA